MDKEYNRIILPKSLDEGTSYRTATWVANSIHRRAGIPVVYGHLHKDTKFEKGDLVILGGVGGLTLDILAYGSVCDWLGFRVPMAPIYSMTNISDLMILVSAPVASIICVKSVIGRIIATCVAIAIIGANTFYHLAALYHFTMFY